MKNYLFALLVIGSMAIVGCDRTVSSTEKKTSSSDGSSSSVEQKTVQHPDGSTSTEKQVKENANH
jgi:ABC-type enterochelin transport system substrate-binding protein